MSVSGCITFFQSSEKPPHSYCSKIPMMMAFFRETQWPVFKTASCFFLICLCFQYFCHRVHTSQCKISKPSGRLQFKAPSPVFAISTSPLPSVEATRQPHVPRLSQLEQIPTNLGQISTGCPICKNQLAEFLHFF